MNKTTEPFITKKGDCSDAERFYSDRLVTLIKKYFADLPINSITEDENECNT